VRSLLAASTHAQAAGVIASFGVEVAFLIASVAAAVFAAIVAMEMQRSPVVWAIISFFATFIGASAVHAVL
jgi:uncharacterized membrane protein